MSDISTIEPAGEPATAETDTTEERLLDDEFLVEEISIDGMCGVY
jgi:mycofactocin precursor